MVTFKKRVLFSSIFFSLLFFSFFCYANASSLVSGEDSTSEKGLTILESVVGLDLNKYESNSKEWPRDRYLGVIPQENVFFNFESDTNSLNLLCTFANKKLHILQILENEGTPYLSKSTTGIVDNAKSFLNSYSIYSGDPFYNELESMLKTVNTNENLTTVSGNIKFDFFSSDAYKILKWSYTLDGVSAERKSVSLGFENGFLKYFIDSWDLYDVSSTSINLSEKEAIDIAMEQAKNYSWNVGIGNDTFEINNFNVTSVVNTQLVFCNSLEIDNVRDENLLMLYPMWRIGVGLDNFYPGKVYGIYVDIWADTKEVRQIQEVFTTIPLPAEKIVSVDDIAIMGSEKQTSSTNMYHESISILWILLSLSTIGAIESTIVLFIKNKKSYNMPKINGIKLSALLCLLLSTMFILSPNLVANASIPEQKGRATVWGSLAPDKTSAELNRQELICTSIENRFIANDYDTTNYQGSYSTRTNLFNDIDSSEENFHRTATVWFDHGIGDRINFPGHPGEWHFTLRDSNNDPVYDYEIFSETHLGKTFFAFISTCMSAKLDLINPLDQSLLGNGSYGNHPDNYEIIGMPYAWTHGAALNTNGYENPDGGDFVYLGFPWGSPALVQDVDPEDYPGITYYSWVWEFFKFALTSDMSIKNALDQASLECFNSPFGLTDLHLNFTAVWEGVFDDQDFPDCTMEVYGNGNIHLFQQELIVQAEDQYVTSHPNEDIYVDLLQNLADTSSTIWITGGDHTFWMNDFWEAGYTGNRYTFSYWEPEPNWKIYYQPVTLSFDEDTTMTVRFNKAYSPGDVDGDGDADQNDLNIFNDVYPSERGDSNWDSRCDFNNDGEVDTSDYNYLDSILNPPPIQYSLSISVGSGGTTSPSPGTYWYTSGTPVQVTANEYTNYDFSYWTLDGQYYSSNPIATINMYDDHTIQAIFVQEQQNNPPTTPTLTGPQSPTYANQSYQFTAHSTDPEGDNIVYNFYWDDSTMSYYGYYTSGTIANASHSWSTTGIKNVTVKVIDTHNAWSDESNYTINIESPSNDSDVGVWHFNEGSGSVAYDSSSYGNDGTISGASWTSGQVDDALNFDGYNDYVEIPHDESITGFTEAFTAQAWIRMDNVTRRQAILQKFDTSGEEGWFVDFNNNNLQLFVSPDGSNYENWGTYFNPQPSQWYHIAIVWQANQTPTFYINGDEKTTWGSGTVSQVYNNSGTPLYVGRCPYSSTRYFDGKIDEVYLYSEARSAQQIIVYYDSTNSSSDTNVGIWHFDEGSGSTAGDSSSYSNHGMIIGASWTSGKLDDALQFDGTNDYIRVPHDSSLTGFNEAFTVQAWIEFDDVSSRQSIIHKYDTSNNQRGWFLEYDGNNITLFASPDGSTYDYWGTNFNPSVNTWYHVAAVWQENQVPTFYIDGQPSTTWGSSTISQIYNNAQTPLDIGRSTYSEYRFFEGKIDEVYLYSEARSAQQIEDYYDSTNGSFDSQVGFWHFDEGSGSFVTDSSAYENDGTIHGASWTSGQVNGSLSFDGSNDYVEIPHDDSLAGFTDAFTVQGWIRLDDITSRQSIVHKYDNDNNQRGWFIEYDDDVIKLFASSNGLTYEHWETPLNPTQYTWYHFAVIWESGEVPTFYVDGDPGPTWGSATISQIYNNSGAPLHIGRSTYSEYRYFDGRIDEIQIYSQSLTAQQIEDYYNSTN